VSKLERLLGKASDKNNFTCLDGYVVFALEYLEFIKNNLQAVIVSKNENNYQFFQYKKDGTFNVTRPINSSLMYSLEEFESASKQFVDILGNIQDSNVDCSENRMIINRSIYSVQQCIGATLDALPANKSNTARKICGDLFERLIKIVISDVGVDVSGETVSVPVNGKIVSSMIYQHDLVIRVDSEIKAIGSVKTSSKDRIDKIFIDKFMYNKLTEKNTPHFAVFLNDVQRKGREGRYGINATFLSGRFKGYTVKLNPLDGVYYCDIRPNMISEDFLKDHIKTFDHFLFSDVWNFLA
jgi:hypothetical protein